MHKLILCPRDPTDIPCDTIAMVANLAAIGLIRGDMHITDQSFEVGDNFPRLISFLGCFPVISSDASGNGQVTANLHRVSLSTVSDRIGFIVSDKQQAPRCPSCRQAVTAWEEAIDRWWADPAATDWTCSACEAQASLYILDWRQTAGFASVYLAIYPIHPAEAVPGERLLAELGKYTQSAWQYYYL